VPRGLSALVLNGSAGRTGCTWAKMPRTNVLGGVKVGAETLSVCQDACIDIVECDGFDWNDVAAAGESCWLSGPWSGRWRIDIAPYITHYVLTRGDGCRKLWISLDCTLVIARTALLV